MLDWDTISIELQKPLDKAHVKPAKARGPKGDYIEAWHAQAEANRIFGFGAWSQEVMETNCVQQSERTVGSNGDPGWGVSYTARVRVTVAGVIREDFGAGHGIDRDLGQAHESAIKEAVSDAMKRALKSFGNPFGLALYDKTQANVADVAADEARANAEKLISDMAASMETCATLSELSDVFRSAAEMWKAQIGGQFPARLVSVKDKMKAALSAGEEAPF